VEALTQAAQLYFTGVQDLSRQAIASAQSLSEQTIEGEGPVRREVPEGHHGPAEQPVPHHLREVGRRHEGPA
jgi:hypothetical protein